jgi:hypothetical protein
LIVAIGVAGGVGGAALMVLPDALLGAPIEIYWFVRHPFWRVLAVAILLVFGPARIASAIPRRLRDSLTWGARRVVPAWLVAASHAFATRAGRALAAPLPGRLAGLTNLSEWALGGPATVVAGIAAALFLLTWIPHYLTWPWWPDVDQFAVSAQSWSVGIVPYRDLADFDFPGPIYQHYLLGKIFGWGATVAFYAMDASFMVVLGVALVGWSRRLFGSALPGLVSYLTFLVPYLSFDYSLVAERDWHAPLLVVLGLFALEVWPGRWGRVISALALGWAFAFRPQEIVFLPAMAAAVDEGGRRAGESWRRAIRPWLAWSALLAVSLVLAFSPLILAGVLDDFVRCVRSGVRGPYNVRSTFTFTQGLLGYFRDPGTMLELAAVVLLAINGPEALRRPARTWGLALLGVLFYKPMSPWPHFYLNQPITLIRAINLALIVAWLMTTHRMAAWARLATLAVILSYCVPGVPKFCTAAHSLQALGPLFRGEDPVDRPPGCGDQFGRSKGPGKWYRWEDYRPMLAYIRESTSPGTRIANLLWNVPYPTVNGPAGRLTPFPAAAGYIHLWMVDPSLRGEYVALLERNEDILVVWGPGTANPFFPELDRTVQEWYLPVARFGEIEVWRHRHADVAKTSAVEDTASRRQGEAPARDKPRHSP